MIGALEQALEETIIEKPGVLSGGKLQSFSRYSKRNNLRNYQSLTSQLDKVFHEEFPQDADRMGLAVRESLKNYLEHRDRKKPGRIGVELYTHDESLIVKVIGTEGTPHSVGCKSAEERGYDPNNPQDMSWIFNGRDGKYGWGTICILNSVDFYARSADGKSEYLGFNLKSTLSKAS